MAALRRHLESLRDATQQQGKRAFDRDDPAAAKSAAERLGRIDHAGQLLDELSALLDDLMSLAQAGQVAEGRPEYGRQPKPATAARKTVRLPHPVHYPDRLRESVL
ncbi:MAG: hypothetical protein ACK41F_11770 [Fimbriimonadaceae bacterium]